MTIWFAVVVIGLPNLDTADAIKNVGILDVNGASNTIAVVLDTTWLVPIITKNSQDISFSKKLLTTGMHCKLAPITNIERNSIKTGYLTFA